MAKGKSFITVEHHADGTKTTLDHASKKSAMDHGRAARKQGRNIFAHSSEDAEKHGLDPRKGSARVAGAHHAVKAPEHIGAQPIVHHLKALSSHHAADAHDQGSTTLSMGRRSSNTSR